MWPTTPTSTSKAEQTPIMENIAGGNVVVKTLAKVRFSASGTHQTYAPHDAVLNGEKCWCPKESQKNKNQWLQIDMGRVLTVQGFEMQGHPSYGGHWCKKVRVTTSIDQKKWEVEGAFPGNQGPNDVKNNKLKRGKNARYVRFYPMECGGKHGGWGKLRVEIFWTEPLDYIPPLLDAGETKERTKHGTTTKGETKKGETEGKEGEQVKKTREEINHELGIPEYPGTVVTLCTELLRLRGGPYWSESYAILRATPQAKFGPYSALGLGKPTLCVVDHRTDGGRWILLGVWQSEGGEAGHAQVDMTGTSLPSRCVGSRNIVTNVNQFGHLMGSNYDELTLEYNQKTAVSEVRVFGCSLQSDRIVHYKTTHTQSLIDVNTNVLQLCQGACKGTETVLPPHGDYVPLAGHHRFGGGGYSNSLSTGKVCDPVARVTGCCARGHGMSKEYDSDLQHLRLGLVRGDDDDERTTDDDDSWTDFSFFFPLSYFLSHFSFLSLSLALSRYGCACAMASLPRPIPTTRRFSRTAEGRFSKKNPSAVRVAHPSSCTHL